MWSQYRLVQWFVIGKGFIDNWGLHFGGCTLDLSTVVMHPRFYNQSVGKVAGVYRKRWPDQYRLGPVHAMIGPPINRARTHQRRNRNNPLVDSGDYECSLFPVDHSGNTTIHKSSDGDQVEVSSVGWTNEVQWYKTAVCRDSGGCCQNNKPRRRINRTGSHLFLLFATAAVFIALAFSPGNWHLLLFWGRVCDCEMHFL